RSLPYSTSALFPCDTTPPRTSTLSLHDALPISARKAIPPAHWGYLATGVDDDATVRANRDGYSRVQIRARRLVDVTTIDTSRTRSEEHTSELQSLAYLVCRLLLEKKKLSATRSS